MNSLTLEAEVLIHSLRSFVSERPDPELGALMRQGGDARKLFELARANKLGAPLRAGLLRSLEVLPADLEPGLNAYQAVVAQRNAANLTTLREVVPPLESAGLEVVVLKGPAHQQVIYGNYFIKPAGDVDLLVPERDYDRGGQHAARPRPDPAGRLRHALVAALPRRAAVPQRRPVARSPSTCTTAPSSRAARRRATTAIS